MVVFDSTNLLASLYDKHYAVFLRCMISFIFSAMDVVFFTCACVCVHVCLFGAIVGSLGEEVLLGGQLLAAALTEQRQPSQEHEQEQPEEHSFAIGPATSTVRALVARGLAAGRDAAQTTASGASFSLPSGSKSKGSQGKQSKSKQQAKKNKHQNKEAETEEEEEEEEDEDEGWEGEAFNELRAGLFEAHGIRPREIAVALGAVQGNGGVKSPTKSADNISAGKRWGALLRQVRNDSTFELSVSVYFVHTYCDKFFLVSCSATTTAAAAAAAADVSFFTYCYVLRYHSPHFF